MKDEIEKLVKHNYKLLHFFQVLDKYVSIDFFKNLLSNSKFNEKIKESLDYYKPRNPEADLKQNTLFLKTPISNILRELLHEISIDLVNKFFIKEFKYRTNC
jgi:hypothetical protein